MSSHTDVQRLEDVATVCSRLIDALRISAAPAEVLGAVQDRLQEALDLLAPFQRPGPHSQADGGSLALESDSPGIIEPHRVMPFSPIIGRLNPASARIVFEPQDKRLSGHGSIPVRFVGAPQTAHGGYVAAILDELMGVVNLMNGEGAFTGVLSVRYHRPTPIDAPLELEAEMLGSEGRKVRSRAEIRCDGAVTASAEGLFIRPR